jgi:hypothetical protein
MNNNDRQDAREPNAKKRLECSEQNRQHEQAVVERVHRDAVEQSREQPPSLPIDSHTISCTELPEAKPDSPLYYEWNFYRREVQRLITEGHEGRFVLIKGEQVIGIWNSCEEAKTVALQRYLMQACLIHQVRRREPVVPMSARFWACQS